MTITQMFAAAYGIFLIVGGVMGMKAGSKVSLIMGAASGILVLGSLGLSMVNTSLGFQLLTGISGLLAIVFLIRLIKTGAMMPSGMLLIVSLVACGLFLAQVLKRGV